MNFPLITALILCSLSWISVSVSETQTVEVQLGEEVTLSCSKTSPSDSLTLWFRVINRTEARCVSTMSSSNSDPFYCDGFKKEKFNMSSNISTVSLKMKTVDISDSGLYFCGFYIEGRVNFRVIHLNVEGSDESHDDVDRKSKKSITKLMSVILGGLTVFLVMVIICLVVKIGKLQKAASVEENPQQHANLGSDDLNYAAVNFSAKARRREVEPNVVYSATR
ncbi:uncharacterized protein LOC123980786 [Micropterus dolomieu]|uniref:uncharacterized protein LOC123980786 n=1 Tax=Micropterus dolomieu TaxID=147949 RepID=UPI001E8CAF1F|nr:uncharacterized protein LOC123980786 [Micropterus dolomieu]